MPVIPPTSVNQYEIFFDGDRAHSTQLAAIAVAQSSVYLSVYILDGRLGQRYLQALRAKAKQGVDVRLLIDHFGSRRVLRYMGMLRAAGVQVKRFSLLKGRRNHRKLLVVDGVNAFVGGMNICDHYRGANGWRDTQLRVEGDTRVLLQSFFAQWNGIAGDRVSADALIRTGNKKTGHVVSDWFAALCAEATHTIWLHQCYFLPSNAVLQTLVAAVERGVEVNILLPQRSNLPLLTHAMRGRLPALQASGINIFEYHGRMLHAKTITVDHAFVAVGSLNFDSRSCLHNDELMVVCRDTAVVRAMHEQLLLDQSSAVLLATNCYKGVAPARQAAGRLLQPFF